MASQALFHRLQVVAICIHICNIMMACDASLCPESSSKFLVEPIHRQIRKGENAVFQCSVADFNQRTKSIDWKVYPNPFSRPVITETYYGESRMLISNVTVLSSFTHNLIYISCIVEEVIQQKTVCFSSRQALMDTIYFPTQDELSCNSLPLSEVNMGETLSLTCSVHRGNPPVDLSWQVVPGGKKFPPSLNDEGSFRVLTHDLSITRNLHLNILRCKVSSEFSFPGEKLQCSIGPIMVRHPPEVHVYPQTKSIKLHELAELTCTADAYPEVHNFTWTCFPEGVLKGCGITSSSRHSFILNETGLCMSKVEGVHIACSAINLEGKGTGYAYLDIPKDIITCKNNYTIHSQRGNRFGELHVNISVYQNLVTEGFTFVCVIFSLPMVCSAHFQWYIGNTKITSDRIFLVQTLPAMSTLTLLTSVQRPELTKTFTCEATVDGMRATASTNLSSLLKIKQTEFSSSANTASFEYSRATPLSNNRNTSVNEQPTEYSTYVKVTSVNSTQNFPDKPNPNGPIIEPIIVMIISGIVLLIATIMIIINIYLCRVDRKAPQKEYLSSNPMNPKPHMNTHANIEIEDDLLYEIPNAHAAQTTSVVFVSNSSSSSTDNSFSNFNQNLHHDYFTVDSPEISSVNLSDSQSDHYDDSLLQDNYATPDALYENKGQLEIHFTKGKSTKNNHSKAERQQILEKCEEYPMPEFPTIHGN